ncbi:MAG TPA: TauD/TfdA family dioxygenase [Rhodospirillaceae bacterium]|nr:taurine catabolism dioxygenase [Rhodospirillaceae bacterium]HAT35226.1 TauD/TfdA family dioxygenase [Rhodospirillaceae bacterium]
MALDVRKLGDTLGAEIIGFDLQRDLNEESAAEINEVWGQNGVLCFRDQQSLSPQDFVILARVFGDILPQLATGKEFSVPDVPDVGIISNRQTDPVTGDKVMRGGSWHTDHSHAETPPRGTILHALELPDTGGDTMFANCRAAYREMPADLKERTGDRKAHHVYLSSRSPRKMPTLRDHEKHIDKGAWHPLGRTHPPTGEKSIYLNPIRTESVEGLEEEDGFDLLDDLLKHATQEKYQYAHKWHPGDVIIWDNRCTLHAASFDYDQTQTRLMHRIMVAGEPSY